MQQQKPPFQQGLEAVSAGDYATAAAIAERLFARDPNDVHALQIVGFSAFQRGRNDEALRAFIKAESLAPGQPALLYWIGVLFKERADFKQAEDAFSRAVQNNPRYGEAWCHLGETLYLDDRRDEATAAFERALSAEPNSPAVLARAAIHFETVHDVARARALAERALKIDPRNQIATIALIDTDLREKNYEAVLDRANEALTHGAQGLRNTSRLSHASAQALEQLGRYDEAFAAFAETKRLHAQLETDHIPEGSTPMDNVNLDRMIAFLRSADLTSWGDCSGLEGRAPVFLLGFVRSGTTWLDQILSSHPDVAVIEEEDNLVDAWRDLLISDEGIARLPGLTREEINRYRAKYFKRADDALGERASRRVIVDKAPLKTAHLPLIQRLFPDSSVILALRDPRDCVMSAFQQNFHRNAGMLHFLDLEEAARFYDRVMTIGDLVRACGALPFHEIRYEDVVADFDNQVRQALDFIGLDWSETVRDYDKTARERAVRTASARQVVQKPYKTSVGKWRRYEKGLAPALPILAPWVERYGYGRG